jgi:hypothetical protein
MDIVNILDSTSNQTFAVTLLSLAVFRVYLEVIRFDFAKLPITRNLGKVNTPERLVKFHRMGFYFSVGYILLFAPGVLLS